MRTVFGFISLWCLFCGSINAGGKIRAPSVFRADEADLHKYSAVLAASEPIRQHSQEQIKNSLNPLQYFFHRLRGLCCVAAMVKFT